MKNHTKVYLEYFEYTTADFIPCEVCDKTAVDIHHIDSRKIGGSKTKDVIENLMAVCRECHNKYGDKKQYKEFLQQIHNKLLK